MDGILSFSPGEYFKNQGKSGNYITEGAAQITKPVFITSAKGEKNSWWKIYEAIPGDQKQYFLPQSAGNHGSRALWEKFGDSMRYWDAVEAFNTFKSSKEKKVVEQKEKQAVELDKIAAGFDETDSGLRYKMIQKGGGAKAQKGNTVSVHYEGSLLNGQVFDSSYKRNQPIDFQLGVGQVIPGWDEGIGLLGVGDKARFVIPSNLAYGTSGAGGVIPPNATLLFDVELMDVK